MSTHTASSATPFHERHDDGVTAITCNHDGHPADPRYVLLNASDVLHRYGWGKT